MALQWKCRHLRRCGKSRELYFTFYKGYEIIDGMYEPHEYTVCHDGDEIIFDTLKEAKAFIDRVVEEEGWGIDEDMYYEA